MNAKQFIDKYSFYPLHKTHLKTEKSFQFFEKGIVGYQNNGDTFVVAGDPICPRKTDIPKVLDEFYVWARKQDKVVCGYYFSEYVAKKSKAMRPYNAGITIGSYLKDFSSEGKGNKEVRRALNYGEKRELQFKELNRNEYFENFYAIKNLESKWFKNKAKSKQIKFLLSSVKIDNEKISDRHFIILDKNKEIVAYVSLDQYKEDSSHLNFYVDHIFQHPGKYKLALDFLITKIKFKLKSEGHKYLDFGFCPFKDVKPKSFVGMGLYLTQFVKYFYNAKGIYNYKRKFCNSERPVFLMMSPGKSKIKQMYSLFDVTFN